MKALSKGNEEFSFDLSKIKIERVFVGDIEIFGGCVLAIKPPLKGSPFWEVKYDSGNGISVLYAASTPVKIEAVEIIQEYAPQEEVVEDDE